METINQALNESDELLINIVATGDIDVDEICSRIQLNVKQLNRFSPCAFSLGDYIQSNYSNKSEFARAQGVKPQQITEWINKRFIVVDDVLYSPRRELEVKNENT